MKTIKGLKVLERAEFEKYCPSFYQTRPHAKMSDRYTPINSREIAVMLFKRGWYPVFAKEQRSNKRDNRGFNRHIVRFSNPDYVTTDGDMIQLIGTNSHNGISAYNFLAGIWRKVCSNGLIAQTASFGNFKIKHMGDINEVVMEATAKIADSASLLASGIEDMKAIELTQQESGIFAATALDYVYGDQTIEENKAPISADRLLTVRRSYDKGNNLWQVFNRVQENVIKGGLRGYNPNNRRKKRVTTRRITSIDKDLKLNKALWTMAERMKTYKLEQAA